MANLGNKEEIEILRSEAVNEIAPVDTNGDEEKNITSEKYTLTSSENENENDGDAQTTNSVHIYHSRGVRKMDYVKYAMDNTTKGKTLRLTFCASLFILAWALSLDSVTTYNYTVIATSSFGHHAMISTTSVATGIIGSICQPMISKIADVSSRAESLIVIVCFYVLGYIVTAASKSISAYICGQVLVSVGSSGLNFLISLLAADITPLKYRGLLIGITSFPYFINFWYGAYVASDIISTNWRWGYGMFTIIVPVCSAPLIFSMYYLEHIGEAKMKIDNPEVVEANKDVSRNSKEWFSYLKQVILEVDLFGLILMGFGWSLLLLPFSLYAGAKGEWKNPSIIAMFVVGGLLLIFHACYEFWLAPYPSMPKRLLVNRTFLTACVIDFFYQCGGMLRLLYFSSYVYVIKNWSYKNWNYFSNSLGLGLCFFGLIVGIVMRLTHRSKFIQIFGLALQVIAMGITLGARYGKAHDVSLVWSQLLIGIGGACSVVGSSVACQASVPHQDVGLAISLLNLVSSIGSAIGSAVGGAIWTGKMYNALRRYIPSSVSDADVYKYYGDIDLLHQLPMDDPIRTGAIEAYFHVVYYLFAAALGLTCIPFIVSFTQRNYYLGDDQNAIETKEKSPLDIFERGFLKLIGRGKSVEKQ